MKKRSVTYYLIGGKILGREENGEYFLNRGSGWFRDTQCAILDRLVGYDSAPSASWTRSRRSRNKKQWNTSKKTHRPTPVQRRQNMNVSKNIRALRDKRGWTQEKLAERMGVSFQAVSSWERGEYLPDAEKLIRLAELFDVSLSALTSERPSLETTDALYDWEHMKTYVKTTAKALGLSDTARAVDFAAKAHEGQTRKRSDVPYLYHPLNLACHALALGIADDGILAACLLHDVIEDCGKQADDLPVGERARELVRLLTCKKADGADRERILDAYYAGIASDPEAALIKCMDRCNNLTTMAWGLSRDKIYRMIRETERYFPRSSTCSRQRRNTITPPGS